MDNILTKINAWLHRKESEKFTTDGSGNTAVNVTGNVSQRGLFNGGFITKVPLVDSAWTALERSGTTTPTGSGPSAGRNSISIQNRSKKDIVIQYDNTADAAISILIRAGSERFYDLEDSITIYARTVTGVGEIILEEIS